MGSFMSSLFIDVTSLPNDGYGFIQLLMLGAGYGFVLMHGSNMIKDGSELLLLVPSLAGVVGSIVLPVLGAVPDGAILIFSGLGNDAQTQIAVGVGALAGSTVMLLTVPWILSIYGGRVNMRPDGTFNYIRDKSNPEWKKLDPPTKILGTGVKCGTLIGYNAKVMLVTLVSFLIVQIPAIVKHCAETDSEDQCQSPPIAALIGGIVAFLFFCFYLWDQARISNQDEAKEAKIDELRKQAMDNGLMTFRALFPVSQLQDREGEIQIDKESKRFQGILRPYFRRYDTNGDEELSIDELEMLLRDMGEKPTKQRVQQIMSQVDTDNSGAISFAEFTEMMVEVLRSQHSLSSPMEIETSTHVGKSEPLLSKAAREDAVETDKLVDDEEDDEEEEPEMPEDLAPLSPEQQQRRLLIRSFQTMGIGVLLVLFFSDPMVDVLSELGNRMNIKPFFVAFVLAPIASNASELIAAFAYSQKKTEKTMTISLSSLIGAACMNNTFCLAIFLILVYVQKVKWVFTAETFCIIFVELAMFFVAIRREHPSWTMLPVILLFPLSIGLVVFLEAVGLD